MGKFLEDSVGLDSIEAGTIIEGKTIGASDGIYRTLNELRYLSDTGHLISVPIGYITDGFSKPWWSKWLVGGRFEDDPRPAVIHDYCCQYKGYFNKYGKYVPLTFNEVNDIFFEAMVDVKIRPWKRRVMRFAVNFNPSKW